MAMKTETSVKPRVVQEQNETASKIALSKDKTAFGFPTQASNLINHIQAASESTVLMFRCVIAVDIKEGNRMFLLTK